MAQWVPCLSEFLFFSIFVRRFFYLANNFHITAGAVGSSFSGLPEICGKINFPNMLANTMFESGVRECTRSLRRPKRAYFSRNLSCRGSLCKAISTDH